MDQYLYTFARGNESPTKRFRVITDKIFKSPMEENTNQFNEELLASISEIFLKYGLRSTSMDDIATHLKISKKTLYQQFTNKDDVVEQVMLYRRRVRIKNANTEGLDKLNPIEVISRIKDFMESDLGSRIPANYYDMKKYHPAVYQKVVEQDATLTKEFLVTLLDSGIKKKYFKDDVDKELQLYLLGKQLQFLREPEVISQIIYPLSVIITTIFVNFIYAVSTEKGIKEFERLKKEAKMIK